jgi:hypothetical protein
MATRWMQARVRPIDCDGQGHDTLGNADLFVTPAKAGVQLVDFTGFRLPPE